MNAITHKWLWPSLISTLLLVTGCQQAKAQLVPAVVTSITPASKAQLQQAIKSLLYRDITIADNAFSQTSDILIERAVIKDERGLPIMGRNLGQALKLSLMTDGKNCFLQSSETGTEKVAVSAIGCKPAL